MQLSATLKRPSLLLFKRRHFSRELVRKQRRTKEAIKRHSGYNGVRRYQNACDQQKDQSEGDSKHVSRTSRPQSLALKASFHKKLATETKMHGKATYTFASSEDKTVLCS